MIDVIVSGGLNLSVEDTGDIINVTVEVAAPIAVEVVVGIPTKEGIVGLSKDDSPEFADVVIPNISEESSYTASAWAWLTGIFGAVTGSVKAMLVGLVEGVASLDERVGELEEDYLLKYVVPEPVLAVDLTHDKYGRPFNFKEGEEIELIISAKEFFPVVDSFNRFNMMLNEITSSIYFWYVSKNLRYVILASSATYKNQYVVVRMSLVNGSVQGSYDCNAEMSTDALASYNYSFHTEGFDFESITSIRLQAHTTRSKIASGTTIIVKKR